MITPRLTRRFGRVPLLLIATVVGVVLVGGAIIRLSGGISDSQNDPTVILHVVERSDFEAFVTEPGDVVSSNNVDVRCQVESRGSSGTAIVSIVEEGTWVEPGDLLVEFDSSVLENELIAQKIVAAQDKSALIQANSNLANAERTLNEYIEGLYEQEADILESAVFVAEEELRKKDLELESTRRMAGRGLIKPLQVTASEFAVEKSKKDVAAARRALRVFREFTREKKVGEFNAEIEKQKANVEAAEFTLELSRQKLSEIEEQIGFCKIKAPSEGQVVYANERHKGEPVVIEEGSYIRYNQIVARLPDIRRMQVDVKINESHVNRVKPGMSARIILDADPDNPLKGVVTEVAPYPFPMRWHGSPLEYGVDVAITDPPPTIRPGLRAKVSIFFEAQEAVLQVPLAAVIAHNDRHYCLVQEDKQWRVQKVDIGPNNNNDVVVKSGIDAGDRVSLTPFRFIDRSELPQPVPDTEESVASSSERGETDDKGGKSVPSQVSALAIPSAPGS